MSWKFEHRGPGEQDWETWECETFAEAFELIIYCRVNDHAVRFTEFQEKAFGIVYDHLNRCFVDGSKKDQLAAQQERPWERYEASWEP